MVRQSVIVVWMERIDVVKLGSDTGMSERRYRVSQTCEVDFAFVRGCVRGSIREYLCVFLNEVVGAKSLEDAGIMFVEGSEREYGRIMVVMGVTEGDPRAQGAILREKLAEEGIINQAERGRHAVRRSERKSDFCATHRDNH